ncbi:Thiol-disulfide oxidoreductase ResA [Polaribacter huanghezhanensis]|nr:Thiol-disulfide oxidoreductase ResA [Polaribacter huanghezhanensis]
MRYNFFILTIFFSIQLISQNGSKVIFELEKNPDTIFINDQKLKKEIILTQDGTANFKNEKPKYFGIINYGYKILYLEKGFNLKVKGKSIKDSIWFEGRGSKENNYLLLKSSIISKLNTDLNFFDTKSMKKEEFYTSIEKYKNLFIENLNGFKFDSNLFYNIELTSINFIIAKRVAFYQGKKTEINKDDLSKYANELVFPFNKIKLNDENALAIDNFAYVEYIQKYFEKIMRSTFDEKSNKDFNQEIQILASRRITNQKILDDFILHYTWGLIKYLPKKEIYFNTFLNINSNTSYKKTITDLYNSFSSVKKGMISPDFEFIDKENDIFSLTDFKGKITYLDIWATWCKPCIEDYPQMVNLNEKFGEKINIVSIGYLDTKVRWEKFITIKKPKWKQLFAKDKEQDFFKKYNITGVPRYILLDEQSKIISSSAEKPGNIDEILEILIN